MIQYRELPSIHFDQRPPGVEIDTLVIHSMHDPLAADPFAPAACKAALDRYRVSAHYLIDRDGLVWKCVPEGARAWHAGESRMPEDGRENVNHFSIGVELIGGETSGFTAAQYQSAAALAAEIIARRPIKRILGHSDIAPQRKTDPWNFDWDRFRALLEAALRERPRPRIGPVTAA